MSTDAVTRTAKGAVTVSEPTRTQAQLARRVAESRATVPTATLTIGVDMEACVALAGGAAGLTAAMVVKACALALAEHPRANGAYRDGRFERYARVNVAVAMTAGGTLVAPTLFDADARPVRDIARQTRALSDRAHAGALTSPELAGATFTVFDLGAHAVERFDAIVSPPQAGALAVGTVAPRALVQDGRLVARHSVELTLSSDQRILYGEDAAAFLGHIRALLAAPEAL